MPTGYLQMSKTKPEAALQFLALHCCALDRWKAVRAGRPSVALTCSRHPIARVSVVSNFRAMHPTAGVHNTAPMPN